VTPAEPTRTHAPDRPDAPTGTFDPALDAGLAAAFGPDPTPGGWSQPPLLRDEPSDAAPLVQPSSPEMPRGADSRYQLLGEIARGGMGVIIKGRDPDLGRDLAFKVLKDELAGKPAAEQRFVEEAQVGGQLQHPGVVPDLGLSARFLLLDHDTKFTASFDAVFVVDGCEVKRVGPRAPNMNAFAERWVQSAKTECLDHFLILGENHLRYLLTQYAEHHNLERPHQARGNVPLPVAAADDAGEPRILPFPSGAAKCRERLGGILKHYYRAAA
jgi:putative transposase